MKYVTSTQYHANSTLVNSEPPLNMNSLVSISNPVQSLSPEVLIALHKILMLITVISNKYM